MPRPYTDVLPTRPVWCAGAFHGRRFIRLRVTHDRRLSSANPGNLRFGIRSQPSGSMVVHLEVFTSWARRASPLHRCAPYKAGTVCRWRSMGSLPFVCVTMIGDNLRHLWFGIPPVSDVRSQPSGSMVVHLEVFTNRARHASPLHRCGPDKVGTACRWRSMGAVSFVCVTIIGDNLRHL